MTLGAVSVENVDVLVIGGGMAALQAAVTALEAGCVVGLVTKRRMGRSGSSAMTTGGYAAVMAESVGEDDPAVHFEDTLRGGGDIADPELVRILCDEGPERVIELERMGGAFRKAGDRYALSASGDHSRARSLGAENYVGTAFTIPLADRAEQLGVRSF